MKRSVIALLTACALTGTLSMAPAAPKQGKPNIILLFADDISARELAIYESSTWSRPRGGDTSDSAYRANTPVLDRLAREGCWVTDAWAATVCSPSRAMIMTGRHAHLHKWWHNGDYGMVPDGTKRGRIVPLYETSPILIGHVAQKGGYATYWAGKTQMKQCDHQLFGFDEGVFTPGSYMFGRNSLTDFQLVNEKGGDRKTQTNLDTGDKVKSYAQVSWYWQPSVALMNHPDASKPIEWWPNTAASKVNYGINTYGPDVELDFIFDFMERTRAEGRPFFIYHTSHLGHDAFDWLHPDSGNLWPGTPKIQWDGNGYTRTRPNIKGDEGVYDTHGTVSEPGMHSHLEYLDYQVWLYMKKLKELGIEDDTVFIFCADNGTSRYGKHSHDRQKGTHVPLIIHAPGAGMTKQGKQDVLASMADMLPTIASVAGVSLPSDYEINGKSLWPFLTTDAKQHSDWIYAYKNEKQLIRGSKVLRDGNGKWWDVEKKPADLISFPQITDWETASQAHRAERDALKGILPRFDKHATEHDPKPTK